MAFKQPLTVVGQSQLQRVLIQRSNNFARKLKDFQNLSQGDQNEVYFQTKKIFISQLFNILHVLQLLHQNLPMMMKMQICTFFNPLLMWREQLTPLMGQEEVDRLDGRLKELNITGKYILISHRGLGFS